jgi:16S rRNA (adenine1518-N6/adenine1519-N6)-dimethyltransferase
MGERLGQHFLASHKLAERLADLLEPSPQSTVLELGAGKGIFTAELAKRFKQVVALELDERLLEKAKTSLADVSNITWVHGDMKEVNPAGLVPPGSILAGNLPYNISGIMVARIAGWGDTFRTAYLMLQREVAERLIAPPHTRARSRLTVLVELCCPAQILLKLSPGAFRPPPRVESAFIKLTFPPKAPKLDWTVLEELLRLGFSTRRKKVYGAVARWAGQPEQKVIAGMHALGVDPNSRAEDLTAGDWVKLLTLEHQT